MSKGFDGKELRKMMVENHVTGRELATLLGVHYSSISFWLNGKTTPTKENQEKIKELFGAKEAKKVTDKELKKNASGYNDPTAYKAIKNADSGVEVYRGDIFYVEDFRTEGSEQRSGRPALVVSNNKGNQFSEIVSMVWLTTQPKKALPTHCTIMSGVPSTALCEQVVTISKNRLGNYIRTATEAEMKEVDKCLKVALGLTPDVTCNEDGGYVEELEKELKDLKEQNKFFCDHIDNQKKRLVEKEEALTNTSKDLGSKVKYISKLLADLEERNVRIQQLEGKITPDSDEVVKLKAQVEMLEKQNEKLIDRLIR